MMNLQLLVVCLLVLLLTQQKPALAFLTSPDSQEPQIHEEFSLLRLEFNELTSVVAQVPQDPNIIPICQQNINSEGVLQQGLEAYGDHLLQQSHTLSGFEAELKVKKNYRFQCSRSYSSNEIKHLQSLIDQQYRINIKYDGLAIMEDAKTIGLSIGTKEGTHYILNNFLYILLDVFETDQQTLNPTFRVSGFSGHPLSVESGNIIESADFLKDILNMNHKQYIETNNSTNKNDRNPEDQSLGENLSTEIVFYYQIHVNLLNSANSKNDNNNNTSSSTSNNIKRINNLSLSHVHSLELLLVQTILAPVVLLLISIIILDLSYKSYSKQAHNTSQKTYEQITPSEDQLSKQPQSQSLPQPSYPAILAILLGFGVSTGIVLISISILSFVLPIPYSDAFLAITVSFHAILASFIGHTHYQAYSGKFLWKFAVLSPLCLTTLAALPFAILEFILHNQIGFENGEELHLKIALGVGIYLISTMLGSMTVICKTGNQAEFIQELDEEGTTNIEIEMKQIARDRSQLTSSVQLILSQGNAILTIKRSLLGSLIVLICFSRPVYLILHNIIHYHMVAVSPNVLVALGVLLVASTSILSAAFTFRDFNGPSLHFDWKSFWIGGSSSGMALYLATLFQMLVLEKEVNTLGMLYLQKYIILISVGIFIVCGGCAASFSHFLVKRQWKLRELLNNHYHSVSIAQLQKEQEELRNDISVADYDEGL